MNGNDEARSPVWSIDAMDSLSRLDLKEIDEDIALYESWLPALKCLREAVMHFQKSKKTRAGHPVDVSALFPEDKPVAAIEMAELAGVDHDHGEECRVADDDDSWPIPTTAADRVMRVLADGVPRKPKQIIKEIGTFSAPAIYQALADWSKKGLFVRSGDCWTVLRSPDGVRRYQPEAQPEDLGSSEHEPDAEVPESCVNRIKRYLQFNQPAKPAIISADTGLPLTEVILKLTPANGFKLNGHGWMIREELAEDCE